MKAIVYTKYGSPDVLQLKEVEKPTPQDHEVLIKIHAASVNAYDWHPLTADIFLIRLMGGGLLRPKNTRLGADIAGRVEAVGGNVKQFRPGDEVFGSIGHGGFAEYACAPETRLALKPENLSFEEAAAVPMAALTALQGLRDEGQIHSGQKVLINGASGGVGTFAVQLARYFDAQVTALCGPRNAERMRELGAQRVIDYTREDFPRSGERYDLILGVNGNYALADYRRALAPEGEYVMVGGALSQVFKSMLFGPLMSLGGKKFRALAARISPQDLEFVIQLVEQGKIRPVIDRTCPLEEVPEAMKYLSAGHAAGKVVVRVLE